MKPGKLERLEALIEEKGMKLDPSVRLDHYKHEEILLIPEDAPVDHVFVDPYEAYEFLDANGYLLPA